MLSDDNNYKTLLTVYVSTIPILTKSENSEFEKSKSEISVFIMIKKFQIWKFLFHQEQKSKLLQRPFSVLFQQEKQTPTKTILWKFQIWKFQIWKFQIWKFRILHFNSDALSCFSPILTLTKLKNSNLQSLQNFCRVCKIFAGCAKNLQGMQKNNNLQGNDFCLVSFSSWSKNSKSEFFFLKFQNLSINCQTSGGSNF